MRNINFSTENVLPYAVPAYIAELNCNNRNSQEEIQAIPGEVWLAVGGYEGMYEVSNMGRVKSLKFRRRRKPKLLKAQARPDGGLHVTLYNNGERSEKYLGRLVAQAHVPGEREGYVVQYLNGPNDVRAGVLRWVPLVSRHTFISPEGQQVDAINLRDFCRYYDLNPGSMSKVASGKQPSHRGWTASQEGI